MIDHEPAGVETSPPPAAGSPASVAPGLRQAWDHLADAAGRRGSVWRFLSEALYGPDRSSVEALVEGRAERDLRRSVAWLDSDQELYETALEILGRFVAEARSRGLHGIEEDLAVEHARLFVGPQPPPASPYESVWTDRDQMSGRPVFDGPSADAVREIYSRFGLGAPQDHHDLPDHVATEAEFLHYLCRLEAHAWHHGLHDEAKQLRAAQQEFVTDHLGRFAASFCSAVEQASPDGFYASVAALLRAHLTVETGTGYVEVVGSMWPGAEGRP